MTNSKTEQGSSIQNEKLFHLFSVFLILFELSFTLLIIFKVPYTEIDFRAYMQQVEEILFPSDGKPFSELNYSQVQGETGPLVYPAGHVFIFSILYGILSFFTNSPTKTLQDSAKSVTENDQVVEDLVSKEIGINSKLFPIQIVFLVLYLTFLIVLFKIYSQSNNSKEKNIAWWVLIFLCLSKRIHSLFVLRLFNDCFSMFFFYLSVYFFNKDRWSIGCVFYSIGVSIKMNILLFAPGLLLLLLTRFDIKNTLYNLFICALVQIIIGSPFLLFSGSAISYILGGFDFSRKFLYVWSVNWKFIPQSLFLSRSFHISLLLSHILSLIFIGLPYWTRPFGSVKNAIFGKNKTHQLSPSYIMWVLFSCNFFGIIFSRSLHFQFYLWYFHTLPFLLFSQHDSSSSSSSPSSSSSSSWTNTFKTIFISGIKGGWILATEWVWNHYPSDFYSSLLLFILNFSLFLYIFFLSSSPIPYLNNESSKVIQNEKKKKLK